MLKISIITVCYNSAETIENTIQSVISQTYKNIEYIIVDGKSTDNTLQIIEKYKSGITKIISEKDEGIYFAINKGISMASGYIVGILHADDIYTNNDIISDVIKTFTEKKSDVVYGDLQYVDRVDTSKVFRNWKAGAFKKELFLKGWMPPHPAFFISKACYLKFGVFNTSLHFSADYELMLRMLYKYDCIATYLPEVLVKMRVGGKSNQSLSNRINANKEDRRAWLMNGLKPNMFTIFLKPFSKIKQFLLR